MKKKWYQKNKIRMALAVMAVNLIVAFLAIWQIDVPAETKLHLIEVVIWVVGLVGGGTIAAEAHIDAKAVKKQNE